MERKRVRAFEQRLRNMNLAMPQPFSAERFAESVAEHRGRPLTILMVDTSQIAMHCGLWVSTAQADYVLADSEAPPVLRSHILLHEFGHMLCNHQGRLRFDQDLLRIRPGAVSSDLDDIDPDVIERVLGRSAGYVDRYDTPEEREAEGLASVIAAYAARTSPIAVQTADPASLDLDRLSSALAGDRRWL